MTRDDLIDVIIGHLRSAQGKAQPASSNKKAASEPRGRLFLTEHDIKKRLTAGRAELTIPKDAILSPLAVDWLVLKGVKIVRE
jgi:hypothetical protein